MAAKTPPPPPSDTQEIRFLKWMSVANGCVEARAAAKVAQGCARPVADPAAANTATIITVVNAPAKTLKQAIIQIAADPDRVELQMRLLGKKNPAPCLRGAILADMAHAVFQQHLDAEGAEGAAGAAADPHGLPEPPPPTVPAPGRVRMGPSPAHGQGVFSVFDIPAAGFLLTFYPWHITLRDVAGSASPNPTTGGTDVYQTMEFAPGVPDHLRQKYGSEAATRDFKMTLEENRLHVVGLPELVQDPNQLAHMINDGATVFSSASAYVASSGGRVNAMFWRFEHTKATGVVSLRPISAGEELFVCYGYEYWTRCRVCCARNETATRCGGCRGVFYCSPACQRLDWPAHRANCVRR